MTQVTGVIDRDVSDHVDVNHAVGLLQKQIGMLTTPGVFLDQQNRLYDSQNCIFFYEFSQQYFDQIDYQ